MKINFAEIDKKLFDIKEYKIKTNRGEETVYLVNQKGDVKWTDENKIFKSSLWDSEGNLISAGFRAFVNFGEQPEFEPVTHSDLEDIRLYEKIDGSCIIVSYWHGTFIIRTRKSIGVDSLGNAQEIYDLLDRYNVKRKILMETLLVCKRLNNNDTDTYSYSYIFEYVSNKRDIVLHYDQSDLFLIGKINHNDYGYHPSEILDVYGESYHWNRPKNLTNIIKSESIKNIDDLALAIRNNYEKVEGAVANIIVNNKLILKKMKTEWYFNHHYTYTKFRSTKFLLSYLEDNNLIIYDQDSLKEDWISKEFDLILPKIESEFDFELSQVVKDKLGMILESLWGYNITYYREAMDFIDTISGKDVVHKEIALMIKNYQKPVKNIIWNIIKGSPFEKKIKLKI